MGNKLIHVMLQLMNIIRLFRYLEILVTYFFIGYETTLSNEWLKRNISEGFR